LPIVPPPEPIAQPVHEEPAREEPSLDFNLDDIGTAAPAAEAPAAPSHIDFDLGEPEPAHEPVAEAAPELALPDLDIPSLHVPEPAPAPAALDFDLSGISLELNPEDKPAEKHEAAAPMADLHVPEIAALDMPAPSPAPMHAETDALPDLDIGLETVGDYSNNAEMATKLDLAAAYHEIGDKEGARELLDEVIKGGSPEQIEKAQTLLAKLG
jgi:pilus assembly protein FimV